MLHAGRSPAELCLFRGVVHVVASLATLTVSWKNATFFCVFVSVQCEPVNWKCQLTHFDVYNGRKLVVVVVTSPTGAVAKYCDEYVCLSVCPPGYLRSHTRDLYQFLCMLLMTVAQSSGVFSIGRIAYHQEEIFFPIDNAL